MSEANRRICMACDLRDDPALIEEYIDYHKSKNVWVEVKQSLRDAGILAMEIYRIENRLFMIIEADDTFSLERKAEMDAANQKVQDWEALMWKYQAGLPWAPEGVKWMPLDKIFELD